MDLEPKQSCLKFADPGVDATADGAEARRTCPVCGKPATRRRNDAFWFCANCEVSFREAKPPTPRRSPA
jgi:ribosomal protein L37AE/L43A